MIKTMSYETVEGGMAVINPNMVSAVKEGGFAVVSDEFGQRLKVESTHIHLSDGTKFHVRARFRAVEQAWRDGV